MLSFFLVLGLLLVILLLLLGAALFLPATVRLQLNDATPTITVYLFGIPIHLYPKKKKKIINKKKTKRKNVSPKEKPLPPIPKNADAETILRYATTLFSEICRFTGYCTARLYRLVVIPPAMDADKAALFHTAIVGSAAALLDFVDKNTRLIIMSREAVEIRPNYTNNSPCLILDITLSFAPYRTLTSLIQLTERLQNI